MLKCQNVDIREKNKCYSCNKIGVILLVDIKLLSKGGANPWAKEKRVYISRIILIHLDKILLKNSKNVIIKHLFLI